MVRWAALVVVACIGALFTASGTAAAAGSAVGPGARMTTPVGPNTVAECTADFVFSTGSVTYLGYAAHCASGADESAGAGCAAPVLPLGSPVVIQSPAGGQVQGRLAYSSWATMQRRGESDPQLCDANDFALVRLPAGTAVDAAVPEVGGPTGVDTDGVAPGEAVVSYQPNDGAAAVKSGSVLADFDGGLAHRVVTRPPGVPGDSGAGFLGPDGRAFGVLSTRYSDRRESNGVADLAAVLAYANRYGGLGTVRLVPGTAPFTGG